MKDVNSFLKKQVDDGKTPSIQYAFFNLDSVIYESKYGVMNVGLNTPVESNTTYNIFSVTKTFTALAVLQLVQAGKINLSDPASRYISGFPYSADITVEQLLTHTSGIPNPLPLRWIHLAEEHNDFSRDLFFSEIFKKYPKLDSRPGTKFSYSNLGYVLLGQLIENVSGEKYEKYIADNIIARCGIDSGSLGFEINAEVHATGYQRSLSVTNALLGFLIDKKKFMGASEGKWKPFHNFYTNGTSYGGMVASGNGLIHYARALLRNDSLLINEKYKKILFTERNIGDKPTGMSMSWYTGSLKGHQYFAHAGGGGGYYVELRIYPALGVGSVILFNRSGMNDERILDKADCFFLEG